jgi:hypothetical protein
MSVRLRFGKYKGWPLADVPTGYLRWMLREVERLDYYTRRAAEEVLRARECSRQPGEDDDDCDDPAPPQLDWRPVVKQWFARLSLRYHPDRGGSDAEMRVVTNAHDLLVELLENTTDA